MSDYSFCVSVTDDEGRPVPGATVKVFDVDPLRNDPLPSAGGVTDDEGRLVKMLDPREFKPTTLPGVDYEAGGPNLYFHVDKGPLSLHENASTGWAPDRAVKKGELLTVPLMLTGASGVIPRFTQIGDFRLVDQISMITGLTTSAQNGHAGPDWAFHRTLTLRGKMAPSWAGPGKMQYRFLWGPIDPSGPPVPVWGTMIETSKLGVRTIPWTDTSPSGGSGPAQQWVEVGPVASSAPSSGPTPHPPAEVIEPYPSDDLIDGGWITIPPGVTIVPDVLLRLRTKDSKIHLGGTNTGGVGVLGRLIFEARPSGSSQVEWTNSQVVRINNWTPAPALKIAPAPCAPVENHLGLKYFFDHEYPLDASLTVTATTPNNPDGHNATSKLVQYLTPAFRGWAGVHVVENYDNLSNNQHPLADWAQCPYTVNFQGSLKLTDGYVDAGSFGAPPITFCKRKKNQVPQ